MAILGEESVLVVGRDQSALYEYFRWGFARFGGVSIVPDRRHGDRRGRGASPAAARERRGVERRRAVGSRAELLARGFPLVRRDRLTARPGREARG
jgi:hypothetical protein